MDFCIRPHSAHSLKNHYNQLTELVDCEEFPSG